MAWIGTYKSKKTGNITWRLQFQRVTRKGKEVFSASFKTEKELREFCDNWEHLFYLHGTKAIEIDRRYEARKRKYYDKIKNKT